MPALVILPGMDGTRALRNDLVAALDPIETTVVSYPADRPLGYFELASFARAALPRDRPYAILGESFSGPIAISIAAARPPGLVGLILSCSFARNPHRLLGAVWPLVGWIPLEHAPMSLLSPLLLGRFATQPLRSALRQALRNNSSPVLRARFRAVLDVDVTADLRELDLPTLYLRASEDRLVPHSCAESIARAAPQTSIVEIEGPHLLLQTTPSRAAAAIADFLENLPAWPTSDR
jgi:pimeloyl-ACP methyl ester carboxylesterase